MKQIKHLWFKIRLAFFQVQKTLMFFIHAILLFSGLFSFILMIYELGFDLSKKEHIQIFAVYYKILSLYFIFYIVRLLFQFKEIIKERGALLEFLFYVLLLFVLLGHHFDLGHHVLFSKMVKYRILVYILLSFISIIEISKRLFTLLNNRISPGLLFAGSFLFIIFLGAFMLMLPHSATKPISFINALFTSTSAVCVTGLNVVDVSKVFTPFGEVIIIILIQIGGIGVMTFTSFFALSFMGHSTFRNNLVLKDILNEEYETGIFQIIVKVIFTTLVIELIGALLIFISIHGRMEMSLYEAVFFSFFHAVSGFCNAGFSTLSGNLYDPAVSTNYMLHTVIGFLIIFGGLGFPILFNIYKYISFFLKNKWMQLTGKQKRYIHLKIININTRIAMFTTILLLVVGTFLFFVMEYDNTLKDLSWTGKIATSFFSAVTPRTAGFNNVNLSSLMSSSILLTIILMWIGASPMSTGGGIKTTTFAIGCLNIINIVRGKEKLEISGREITNHTILRSYTVIMLSIVWIMVAAFSISVSEPDKHLTAVFFECFSALATVGLTLDLTPHLGSFSKIVLIVTMFVGRVGLFTLLAGVIKPYRIKNYSFPTETIYVG